MQWIDRAEIISINQAGQKKDLKSVGKKKTEDSDHVSLLWFYSPQTRITQRGLRAPIETCTLIYMFLLIPFVLFYPGAHFELQKSLFPGCVQTCQDIPPGSLPSSFFFFLFTTNPPPFPLPLLLPPRLNHVCIYILAPIIISYSKGRGKSYTGRQEVLFYVYGIEGSCRYASLLSLTVIILMPQQEWARVHHYCVWEL